ncbi:MAG: LysM protein [Frankiales bacterium]|nr:LysM protein [Frankiales bacterium]
MPAVAVTRKLAEPRQAPAQPKAAFVSETGRRVELPYAPVGGDATGFGWDWTPQPRTGRKPLLSRGGQRLRQLTFSPTVVFQDKRSIENVLTALTDLAATGERVRFSAGPAEGRSFYRLSLDSVSTNEREPGTNARVSVVVTFTLTEAIDAVSHVGPLTGGTQAGAGVAIPTVPRSLPGRSFENSQ